jgi:hypothetical protein
MGWQQIITWCCLIAISVTAEAQTPPIELVAYDLSPEDFADFLPPAVQKEKRSAAAEIDEGNALFVKRDATMAKHFSKQRAVVPANTKVLVICGSMHARTAKSRAIGAKKESADDFMNQLWPCFAAKLAMDHPDWRVRSINVIPHSGGSFAMASTEREPEPTEGKVHLIRSKRRLDEAEAGARTGGGWDWQLDLPRATPATFFVTPSLPEIGK